MEQISAVQSHDVARNTQPDTAAFFFGSEKRYKNKRKDVFGNRLSRVGNINHGSPAALLRTIYLYLAVFVYRFNSIF